MSERALDEWVGWDATFVNTGSLEDLWRKVDERMAGVQEQASVA